MTDRSANSQDTFYAALKTSQPGDSVTIAGGSYPAWGGPPVQIAEPGVKVRPAPGAKVVLEGLDVSGSSGLKVSGIEIAVKTWGWKPALYSANAQRNTFDAMIIHSADGKLNGSGFQFRNSQDCALTNSEIHHLGSGGATLQCDRILIDGNRFHDIAVDGVDIGTSNGCKVYRNDFTDFFPTAGAHPDAIQFWDTLNLGAKDNEVRDNTIRGGASTIPPQGIFVESQQNITITGNAMTDTMSNGISLSTTDGALVQGNFVENAGVVFRGGSSKGVFKDNYCRINSPGLYVPAGDPKIAPADFVVSGTVTIPDVPKGDLTAYTAWVAKAKASGGTIPGAAPPPVVTPPPAVTPPPVVVTGPTRADLDAANATIAALQAKAADQQNALTAANAATAAATAQVAALTAQLATAQQAATAAQAASAAANQKIANALAALT